MRIFISNVADSSTMPDDKMVAGGCLMAGDAVNVAKLNPDHTGREAGATSVSAAFDGVRGVHSVFESEKTRDCTPFEKMLKSNDMSALLVVVYTRADTKLLAPNIATLSPLLLQKTASTPLKSMIHILTKPFTCRGCRSLK